MAHNLILITAKIAFQYWAKVQFLVLIEALVHQRKGLVFTLVKKGQDFALVYIIMAKIVICLLIENQSFSLRPIMEIPTSQLCFFLGSISDGFHANESSKLFLEENVFDFSVDYNAIDKSDTLDIHKYLMVKNNAK